MTISCTRIHVDNGRWVRNEAERKWGQEEEEEEDDDGDVDDEEEEEEGAFFS